MTTELDHLKSISAELHAWRVRFNAGQRMKTGDLDAIIQGIDRLIPGPGEAEKQVAAAKNELNNATSDVDRTAARARLRAAEEHLQQVQDVNAKITARQAKAPDPFLTRTPAQRQRIADAEKAVAKAENDLRFADEAEGPRHRARLGEAQRELIDAKSSGEKAEKNPTYDEWSDGKPTESSDASVPNERPNLPTSVPFDERAPEPFQDRANRRAPESFDLSQSTRSYTVNTHVNSMTIDNIASTQGMYVGQALSGNGIALNTFIASVGHDFITITTAANATATGVSLTTNG